MKSPVRRAFVVLLTQGVSGAEKRFSDIVGAMRTRGFEVSLVVPAFLEQRFRDETAIHTDALIPLDSRNDSLWGFFSSYRKWLQVQERKSLHVHYPLNGFLGSAAALRAPHSMSASSTDSAGDRWSVTPRVMGALVPATCLDILNPDVYVALTRRYHWWAHKISLTPGTSFLDPSRFYIGEKRPNVLLMGRLIPETKGVESFLGMVEDLSTTCKQLMGWKPNFEIAGEGPLRARVENEVDALRNRGIDINYLGPVSAPEVLATTSVVLSLQKHSNYPSRVVLEALLSGSSVVVSNVGDSAYLAPFRGVRLVPTPLQVTSLAIAIRDSFLELSHQPVESERIRSAAMVDSKPEAVIDYFARMWGISGAETRASNEV